MEPCECVNKTGVEMPLDMMMMQMTFYISTKVTVLFDIWDIKTLSGIILTSLFWGLAAFLYQGLKYFRGFLNKSCQCGVGMGVVISFLTRTTRNSTGSAGYGAIEETEGVTEVDNTGRAVNWRLHLVQTTLQLVQTTASYFLMLVVMTYNLWLFVAVVVGDAVGYLVFQRHSFDNSDHCN